MDALQDDRVEEVLRIARARLKILDLKLKWLIKTAEYEPLSHTAEAVVRKNAISVWKLEKGADEVRGDPLRISSILGDPPQRKKKKTPRTDALERDSKVVQADVKHLHDRVSKLEHKRVTRQERKERIENFVNQVIDSDRRLDRAMLRRRPREHWKRAEYGDPEGTRTYRHTCGYPVRRSARPLDSVVCPMCHSRGGWEG